MATDPLQLITRDPQWLAHRYDPGHDAVHFLWTPRAAHHAATFLTDQYLKPDRPPAVILRSEALAAARKADGPLHFVFHSAFCCSTLVARALDRAGWAMSLKEPVILNDLVGWRGRGAAETRFLPVLSDVLTLLSRPFAPGEPIIVKPSNVVNGLAMPMMEMRPDAHALLMYASLPDFLASIAKKGLEGRTFARELFLRQLKAGMVSLGFDQDELFVQTDLQVAAMGWLVQMQLFEAMVSRFGPARVRTVASHVLLNDPPRAMAAVAALFGLSQNQETISAVALGPAFTTHSKSGAAFGAGARRQEYADATKAHADEIRKVLVWAEAVASRMGISVEPTSPLID